MTIEQKKAELRKMMLSFDENMFFIQFADLNCENLELFEVQCE